MQHRRVAVRQPDREWHRAVGSSPAAKDGAGDGLEMAITQKRVRLKRGKASNNVVQLVDRAAPSKNHNGLGVIKVEYSEPTDQGEDMDRREKRLLPNWAQWLKIA